MNTNSNSDDSYVNGLDLPLGAGATTSVRYKFNTTVSSTSDAELTMPTSPGRATYSNYAR